MNQEFLYQIRLLLITCNIHYNDNQELVNSSIIGKIVIATAQKMIAGTVPVDEKNSKDFLEMIVESHKDNPRVIESIFNRQIIEKSIELYNQIAPQHDVAK